MIKDMTRMVGVVVFLAAATCLGRAEVKMPAIFGDHMVLQQEATLPVWGTADAGEKVTVTVGKESGSATAGADGKWMVKLKALAASAQPVTMTMTVAGKNSLKFEDVLVGEVWICSGQSNMEFDRGGVKSFGGVADAATAVAQANDPQLRLFLVKKGLSLDPLAEVTGQWQVCMPESAALFSGVGYFFGRDLRKALNRPVGLIGTYWGGTPAQAWTSLSGLKKDPELAGYVEEHDKRVANFAAATAAYPAQLAAFKADEEAWQKDVGATFVPLLNAWKKSAAEAQANGTAVPPAPVPSQPKPRGPVSPVGGPGTPATLFNAMIAPLIPYAIKGTIWYQGEANAGAPEQYRVLFARMITDWREKWGEGNFPFLFVQLAAFGKDGPSDTWPYLRESQLKTLALPKTGMATVVDIGNPKDIHPKDKEDVGGRLALAARHVAYGEKLVYSGPIYDAMKVEGGAVRVSFTHLGSGLTIGAAPWMAPGVQPLPTDKLVGFVVAGADKNWVEADAKIDGNDVVVSSAQVAAPVAVRYDWQNSPSGNLYNKDGLPASPFRTDEWPRTGFVPFKAPAK
jgi:sialate O-acetylesterase